MASYEEVMQALRNAHDAGDNEAATRLAQIASGLKGTSSTQPQPDVAAGDGEGFLDKAIGLGQAAASTITGGIGAATGWIPAALQKANDPNNVNFEQQYAANMGAMTYDPSREKGQEYAGKVGEFVNDVLLPAATGVQGLPYVNTAAPILGAIGRNLTKAGKVVERSPAKSLLEELKKEPEIPVAPKPVEAPLVDTKPSMQKSKEAYERAVRERKLREESAFTPEAEAQRALEEQQGLQQMGELKGALDSFDQLGTEQAAGKRQTAAQEVLNRRNAEMTDAVNQRTVLEQQAGERARQEQAPTGAAEAQAKLEEITKQQEAHQQHIDLLNAQIEAAKAKAETLMKNSKAERAAQELITQRQAELEMAVKQRTRLEMEAAERKRQAEASATSPEHAALLAEQERQRQLAEEARIAKDSERMGNAHQTLIDDTQHVLPDSGQLYASQYGVEHGLGRVDENGMPIRADRSMEAQNLENPLQRNLWGDELPRQSTQENVRGITRAMDITPEGSLKNAQRQALGAPAKLPPLGSAARKALMKKQGGVIDPDLLSLGFSKLFHGGREFKTWNPKTIGSGEGMQAQGPGLYAGNEPALANLYTKYAGDNGVLSELAVNTEHFFNNRKVPSEEMRKRLDVATAKLDAMGLKASQRGLLNSISSAPRYMAQEVRQALVDSGIDGSMLDLGEGLGHEYAIFNPDAIAQVSRADSPVEKMSPTALAALRKKQGGGIKIDWSDRKKAEGFSNIPGIKEKLRDIGNALIKTPQEAIDFAKQTSDVAQNAVQKAFNNLTKGGTYLKGRLNNPVVHFGIDRFLEADGLAKADIKQKLGNEYLSSLRDLSKQEYADAFELLNVADLTQKTLTPELMQAHGLSPKLQQFITTHQAIMQDALSNINRVREATGKNPITAREAYSAMSMNGDYRKVVYSVDEAGNRTVIGAIAANRLKGKLGWTLDKIEKHVQEKMPGVEFGELRDTTLTRGSAKGTPHEAFTDALRTLGENNPHVAELLKVLDEVAKDDASNYMGMQKHTMQKKGIWGMEGRKPWETAENNATQFFENQVRYLESVYNWSHLAEAAKDVNSVIRNPEVMEKHPNAVRLTEDYMMNAMGLNPSRLGRAIDEAVKAVGSSIGGSPAIVQKAFGGAKEAANTMMLTLNESFLMIQALQAPTGIPAAVALLRARGLASNWTNLTLGLDHFVEAGATLLKEQAGQKISTIDRGAIEYAKKNHIYATDMVEHNSRTQKTAGYYASRGLKAPAAMIETATRAQAYLTFVKVLEDGGMKVKDGLYEQAHRMTDQVMNNYSAMEKPPVYNALGPIGSMAYNLKSFGHNELSRWAEYAREIGKTGNPGPLLTQMATTIAVAGAFGLPMFSQFETLYDYITKKLGNPRSLTLDVIKTSEELANKLGPEGYDKFKNAMSHGMFSMLGADVSKRIGLGDVLPSKASDAAFAGGGKLAEMVSKTAGAIVNPDEQHLKAATVAVAPNVIAGPLKEAWYTDEKGVYSMDPDKKRELITEINDTDRLLKKIGITGINESVKKTKDYQLKQLEKAYQDIRDNALVKISHDMANGKGIDPEYIDKYFKNGQGDPSSFEASINDIATKLNIPRDTLALMKGAASSSVQRAMTTQRRLETQ